MDIIKYLSDLPMVTRRKLLDQTHCCLAIYRALSEKDRLVVSRLIASPCRIDALFEKEENAVQGKPTDTSEKKAVEDVENAFEWNSTSSNSVVSFPPSSNSAQLEKAKLILPELWSLDLLDFSDDLLSLDETFGDTLYSALSEPNESLMEVSLGKDTEATLSNHNLIEYARLKWEQLVTPLLKLAHPTINLPSRTRVPTDQLLRIASSAGLVNSSGTALLPDGYTFLLSEIPRQVWILANSFLSKELPPAQRAEGISFLVFIATTPLPGKIYRRENLSQIQNQLLVEWEVFGLIKFVSSASDTSFKSDLDRPYFTVTPLASAIIDSNRNGISIGDWSSGIIVESNFYCYLYTNSSIMIALLQLFAQVTVRLPNMCVARLTRQSVRASFKKGIHAHHIIDYLRSNKHAAHTALQSSNRTTNSSRNAALSLANALSSGNDTIDMETMFPTSKTSGLPEQVEDQLNLWEEERFRFSASNMIHWQFEPGIDDPSWYSATKEYAQDMGALIWFNDKDQCLGVKPSSQDGIVSFYKSLKTKNSK